MQPSTSVNLTLKTIFLSNLPSSAVFLKHIQQQCPFKWNVTRIPIYIIVENRQRTWRKEVTEGLYIHFLLPPWQIMGLVASSSTNLLFYNWESEVHNQSQWVKVKVSEGWFFSETRGIHFLASSISGSCCILWLMSPSWITPASWFGCHTSYFLLRPPCLPLQASLWVHLGPTGITQDILPISRSLV